MRFDDMSTTHSITMNESKLNIKENCYNCRLNFNDECLITGLPIFPCSMNKKCKLYRPRRYKVTITSTSGDFKQDLLKKEDDFYDYTICRKRYR